MTFLKDANGLAGLSLSDLYAKKTSANTFTQPNTFGGAVGFNAIEAKSSITATSAGGGYVFAPGTSVLRVEPNGRVIGGPSPLATTNDKTDMPDFKAFDPYDLKFMARSMCLREMGDTVDIQCGRRPGIYPYEVGTTATSQTYTLPQGTINVVSTAGFESAGSLLVESTSTSSVDVVAYTGKTATSFTGCTGGTQTWATAAIVSQAQKDQASLLILYGSPWSGRGGFQERSQTIVFKVAETHRYDGNGGYYAAGRILFNVTSLGPKSQRLDRFIMTEKGRFVILGGGMFDHTYAQHKLSVGTLNTRLVGALADATTATFISVVSAHEFPTTGTLNIDGTIGTYSGIDLSVYPYKFTGWTYVSGPTSRVDGSNLWIAETEPTIVASFKGNVASRFDMSDTTQTTIGNVGPGGAGGIDVAGASGPTLYSGGAGAWESDSSIRATRASGSNSAFSARVTGDTGNRVDIQADGSITFRIGDATDQASIQGGAGGTMLLTGIPRWTAAGNFQTTVGAAGGGSALPATPTKYMKVKDSGGTTYVVPMYAS